MYQIELIEQTNPQPEIVKSGLQNMRAAKIYLNTIKEAWALDGLPMHYTGQSLIIEGAATYTIIPQ